MRGFLSTGLVLAALHLLVTLFPPSDAHAAMGQAAPKGQEVQDVTVTNFPAVQVVKGSVSIDGVVSHARSLKVEGLLVPTSSRDNISELFSAGIVETEGFTSMAISLQGEVKSNNFAPGTVGVILIPDEWPILRVFRERKLIQFPIECLATIKPADLVEHFSAPQCNERISFPRYKLYFYNTVNTSVETNVYLYLSN